MAYGRLIDSLTADPADRTVLRALARAMEDHPFLADRTEAVIRELARPAVRPDGTEYAPEECLAYATDFMQAIGIPEGLAAPMLGLLGEPALDDVPTEAIEDVGLLDHIEENMRNDPDGYFRNAEAQKEYAQALQRLSAPLPPPGMSPRERAYEREQAGIDMATYERMMREEPGRYWGSTEFQRNYRDAIERRLAADALPAATFVDNGAADPDAPEAADADQ